jgi:hypothetical protein
MCNWASTEGLFEIIGIAFPQPLENLGFLIVNTMLIVLTTTNLLLYLTKIQGLNCDAVTGHLRQFKGTAQMRRGLRIQMESITLDL